MTSGSNIEEPTPQGLAIGLDLGASNVRAALVDPEGAIVGSHRRALSGRGVEACIDSLDACIATLGPEASGATRVGLGLAAQIGTDGRVVLAPNLGWRGVDLAGPLSERLGRRVELLNDLNAAVWGESRAGAARGFENVLLVSAGTGVGAGVLCQGRLLTGARGVATELGHVKIAGNRRRCSCGEVGCVETLAGGDALGRLASNLGRSGIETSLPSAATAEDIMRCEAERDAMAHQLVDQAGRALGEVVATAVTLLNPAVVILSGSVLLGSPLMRERIERTVRTRAAEVCVDGLRFATPLLGDDAGVVGAALHANTMSLL